MNAHRALLLRIIYAKSDVTALLNAGLLYSQITLLMGELIGDGFLSLIEGAPTLTEKGLLALREDSTGKPRRDGGFISPLEASRIDKLPVDAVYLPPYRNSFF